MSLCVLILINECGPTFSSKFGTTTPCGLLRIQNILPLGKWSQKERKKGKEKERK
jgi:hypothetical protein